MHALKKFLKIEFVS